MRASERIAKLENALAPRELSADDGAIARQRLLDLLSRKDAAKPPGPPREPPTPEATARVIDEIKRLARAVSANLRKGAFR